MKKKLYLSFILLVTICVLAPMLFAAGNSETESEVLRIGYTPPTLDKADFAGQFEIGLIKGLDRWKAETGIDYELFSRSPADHGAHEVQQQIVEDFITLDVDFIVFYPTSWEAQLGSYRRMAAENVPFVLANDSRPFPPEWGVTAVQHIGYSHAVAGQTNADYLAERYPDGVKMAILFGEPGSVSDDRGAKEAHISNGFDVVYEDFTFWNREKAYDATERLLSAYPDVEVIVACSSSVAIGAVQAIESAGRTGEIDVFGAGATMEELDFIIDGKLAAAWFRDPIAIGEQAANAAYLTKLGREDELESISWNVPIIVLDSYEDIVEHVNPFSFTAVGREWPPVR